MYVDNLTDAYSPYVR